MLLLVFTLMAGAAFGIGVAEQHEAEQGLDPGLLGVQGVSSGLEIQADVAVDDIIFREELIAILPKS